MFGHRVFAALTVLFLVFAWRSWKNEKLMDERVASYVSTAPARSTTPVASTTTTTAARQNPGITQYENIEATLRFVALKWKITDVNRDGLHNCIDAAVLFYKYFPDKNSVAIIVNVNPSITLLLT